MTSLRTLTSLSNRNVVVSADTQNDGDYIRIGRSSAAMWMRIVSSWICAFLCRLPVRIVSCLTFPTGLVLYIWSLVAPVVMPDWFG